YLDPATATGNAWWTIQCVIHLVQFLIPHLPSTGNTKKFKSSIIKDAVDYLHARIIHGGLKKVEGVKDKIMDLLTIYQAVNFLKNTSRIHYNDQLGANIQTKKEAMVWNKLI
ncbi:hypothetical protein L218DRAFT_802207, partial [Marasmius fiardii PR-910]